MGSLPPPGLLLILGALWIPFLRGRWRRAYLLLLPCASFVVLHQQVIAQGIGFTAHLTLFDYELTPVRVDRLSFLFAGLFHLALFLGTLYALHVDDAVQHVAAFGYAGSAIGAACAGDFVTLFVYWELVAFTSTFLIWARRSERAYAAGQRYLVYQVVSGVLLLAGVLWRVRAGGSLLFDEVGLPAYEGLAALPGQVAADPGAWLILLAVGIKCAFPGLHTWLTDAYPEATPTGTVFLSAFTTKLAVYVLIRAFPGAEVLVGIGAVMILFPIFYAVIENDLRRVLAYSMVNQIGFMVIGVGVGGALALDGAAAHAVADVLFKGLLFMCMGAVLHRTGTARASDLGGLWKSMPYTTALCLVGAAAISAFPLFSAFATKSMIVSAVAEEGRVAVWFAMVFASAGVLHHAGIKIPYCAFFAHDAGLRPREAPWNMRWAMSLAALLCVGIGCFPELLYGLLPAGVSYVPYTASHVVTQLQLLVFAVLAFVVLTRTGFHPDEVPGTNLDVDWLWRRLVARTLWHGVGDRVALVLRGAEALCLSLIPHMVRALLEPPAERGPLHRQMILGSSLAVMLLMLVFFLWRGLVG
ncbi:MAG: Na(+)/H(+) antiporter subunit D [Planctomycetota bacterium]|nr:MAG: Na(+)/H(+) antiporter subunit D [Planctomycetota bacterium]